MRGHTTIDRCRSRSSGTFGLASPTTYSASGSTTTTMTTTLVGNPTFIIWFTNSTIYCASEDGFSYARVAQLSSGDVVDHRRHEFGAIVLVGCSQRRAAKDLGLDQGLGHIALEEDAELDLINARKLAELKRRAEKGVLGPEKEPAQPSTASRAARTSCSRPSTTGETRSSRPRYHTYPRQTEIVRRAARTAPEPEWYEGEDIGRESSTALQEPRG